MIFPLSTALAWTIDPNHALPVVGQRSTSGYVILATDPPPTWYDASKPSLLLDPRHANIGLEAVVSFPLKKLPPELAAYKGQTLTIQGEFSCTAKVSSLTVISRISWMEGYSGWENSKECEKEGSKTCTEQIIHETIEGQDRLLVGILEGCEELLHESAIATPKPTPVSTGTPLGEENGLLLQAWAHFYALPEWSSLQQGYAAAPDGSPFWDGGSQDVMAFDIAGRTLISVTGRAMICTGFSGNLWALWEVTPTPQGNTWTLIASGPENFTPHLIADYTGDGSLELYDTDGLVWLDQNPIHTSYSKPWVGCAC